MARLTLLIMIASFLLAGCAAMVNQFSGLGVISDQKSRIDDSEVVEVSGNHVVGNGGMSSFDGAMLGGRWESISPEIVYIAVTYSSSANAEPIIVDFDEFRVNVNGSISSFKPVGPARISMPLAYLESMLVAEECKLQLIRGPNVTEGDFAIASDAGKPTAKVSLQRFYDKVRATKTNRIAKQI